MSLDARALILLFCLAALDLTSSRAAEVCPSHLQFLESKCAQWQTYVLPKTIPAALGNSYADNEAAAALGMKVFYDNRFSAAGSGIACVNCHDPEHAFTERKATSHTIREIARNAPDLLDAAWYTKSHFWDGKVDNLWSAPLFTFEQEDEMGSTRLSVVHTLSAIYKIRYEKTFGPMPDFSDVRRFPAAGKPGSPQFDAMSETDKDTVNQVYVNVGKALEAYLRKLAAGRSQFDVFMEGSANSLTAEAQRGMVAFSKNKCDSCHFGPTFTDEGFHNLGFPENPALPKDDARTGGKAFARLWQFTSNSKFAEPSPHGPSERAQKIPDEPNGFRTPSLRNVRMTAPYGHAGQFETLDQVIDGHIRVLPQHKPLGEQDKRDIIAFLTSLTGRPPTPPWNYWPGG